MPKEQTEEKVLFQYEGQDILQEYDMPDYFYNILKNEFLLVIKKLNIDFTLKKFNNKNLKNFSKYCKNEIPPKKYRILKNFTNNLVKYVWSKWGIDNISLPEANNSFTTDLTRKKIYRYKRKPLFE